jgi:hypothetical protein
MQELHARHGVAVGIVRVRIERQRCVGEVSGLGRRAHVEERAEIRLAREAEAAGYVEQRGRAHGHAAEDDETGLEELLQPFVNPRIAGLFGPGEATHVAARRIPQSRCGNVVVRGRKQRLLQQVPAEELGLVPVAEPDAITAGFRLADAGDGERRIEIRRIVQSLAGAKVHAARIPAALAQPDRMQREPAPVIELDRQFARRADMQARHGALH